jgi:hypothetical protein
LIPGSREAIPDFRIETLKFFCYIPANFENYILLLKVSINGSRLSPTMT